MMPTATWQAMVTQLIPGHTENSLSQLQMVEIHTLTSTIHQVTECQRQLTEEQPSLIL